MNHITANEEPQLLAIYVDADACPVKSEIYRVAKRYTIKVYVVANSPIQVPDDPLISSIVVKGKMDEADNWIAERIGPGDIGVTSDIPLAERCLAKGSLAVRPNGRQFTDNTIGDTLASRTIHDLLRQCGEYSSVPAAFTKQDRSRFLATLDNMVHLARRKAHANNKHNRCD